jgi:hypothetical protein
VVSGGAGIGGTVYVGDGSVDRSLIVSGGSSGSNAGGRVATRNGSSFITAIGGKSAVVGGAYDATPYIYANGALEHSSQSIFPATTTSNASIRLPHGTAPSSPTNGDVWTTTSGLYVRVNGATVGPLTSGITTLSSIGATPNANGATISGQTLNLQPASGSFGGVVTTGNQTFAGVKTFSDTSGSTSSSTGALIVGGGVGIAENLNVFGNVGSSGDLIASAAGKGIKIKEGSNAKMGTATLVGGTTTVNTTAVAANSRIFLTSQSDGGTVGFQRVSARTAGTSFTITSSSGSDTSTVAWIIFDPAP